MDMEQDIHAPSIGEIPTRKQLNKATSIAFAVAGVLLVTTVMPAEYGIDPTGVGRLLGLRKMGEMKSGTAETKAADESDVLTLDEAPLVFSRQSGDESVLLPPGEGREVKATMQKGGQFEYQWSSGGTPVHYELHGEPKGGAKGEYSSYDIGTSAGMAGRFQAPFDGTQGWYWRNDSDRPVTVSVKATGTWAKFEIVPLKPRAQ
jgi:hypothetical protein